MSSEPGSPSSRLPGLDTLRACAILLVIVWHVPTSLMPFHWKPATWSGVDLFFVLSGYLIGTQLLKPYAAGTTPSFTRYFLSRALRILPVYYVVVALYFTIPVFREQPGLAPLWRFLSFTLNFGLDPRTVGAFSHGWSLCVEEHFYLVLPLVVAVLMRRPSLAKSVVLGAAIVVGGLVLRAVLWDHYVGPAMGSGEFRYQYMIHIYYPTYARLDGLVAGVSIAAIRLFRPGWWSRIERRGWLPFVAGLVVLVGAYAICDSMFSFDTAVFGYPLLALGYGLLVTGCLCPGFLLGRRRVWGMTTIAVLSYCIYLTHKEIMHLDDRFLLPLLALHSSAARLAIYGTTFLAAGALLHVTVERASFMTRDRLLGRRQVS